MSKTVTIEKKENIGKLWRNIISNMNNVEGKVTFIISDVDGTLNEFDEELCQKVEQLKTSNDSTFFMIATGRSYIERTLSTKISEDCLGRHSPIMICQGGGIVCVESSTGKHDYLIPFENNVNEIVSTIAETLGLSRQELFRNEHICIHYYVVEEGREVIGIPIAIADEARIKDVLSRNNDSIMDAFYAGELNDYTIAIREYLDRGMPPQAIGVLYESELSEKVITEMTIVKDNLNEYRDSLNEKGIACRVQEQRENRYAGTRGTTENSRPDIADIVPIGKKEHIDAIINVVKEKVMTIGFGDQENDDFLLSTDYSFVANAAPIGEEGRWGFATMMAKKAEQEDLNIIHARHGKDGNLINWAVKKVIETKGFDNRKTLCEELSKSDLNLSIRRWLQK